MTEKPDTAPAPPAPLREQLEVMPPGPLAEPGTVRVLLSAGASRILQESGEDCFMIVGKCSYPAIPGRWSILLKPVPFKTASEACKVALGTHTARRIKKSPPAATGATAIPHRSP